jgi:ribosomal 50S subunit-associated protein YjgA (DUF615 family)
MEKNSRDVEFDSVLSDRAKRRQFIGALLRQEIVFPDIDLKILREALAELSMQERTHEPR